MVVVKRERPWFHRLYDTYTFSSAYSRFAGFNVSYVKLSPVLSPHLARFVRHTASPSGKSPQYSIKISSCQYLLLRCIQMTNDLL